MAQDLILKARQEALERNLIQVEEITKWLQSCCIRPSTMQHGGMPSPGVWRKDLWDEMDRTIGKRARRLRMHLKDQLESVSKKGTAPQDLDEAWGIYTDIHKQSEEVFDECLEFIGGLAFRDKGFDRRICQVADELIRACAIDSNVPWESLTILTHQERLGQTLARIIRLRFPEWTIWTLPFTAHEFAYVVIKSSTLDELIGRHMKQFCEQCDELKLILADQQKSDEDKKLAKRSFEGRAERYLQRLVADIFATYTMGPAYACAALLLRLTPYAPDAPEDSEHPTDIQRADVILSTLRVMNERAEQPKPYTDIINLLKEEWNSVASRVAARGTAPPADAWPGCLINVDELIRETLREFSFELRASALYPPKGEDGWLTSQAWYTRLREYLSPARTGPLSSYIRITPASKLRDALNAAWLYRMFENPPSLTDITEAALELCTLIIEGPPGGGGGGGGAIPTPSAGPVNSSGSPSLPQPPFK